MIEIFASTTFLGPGRTELAETLKAMTGIGLDGVELGSTHVWRPNLAEIVRDGWRGDLLTHNYFPPAREDLVLNIASRDRHVRRASIEHAKSCIGLAADIGARLYTVHPGFLADTSESEGSIDGSYDFRFSGPTIPYEDAFDLMVESLGELIDAAQKSGVPLAIETEGSATNADILLMQRPEEYERLFHRHPDGLSLNLNLAHTSLAANLHEFSVGEFITSHRSRISAVELSHNDGVRDQHRPLTVNSFILDWLHLMPPVPWILEFRNAAVADLIASTKLLRTWVMRNAQAVS